MAQFQHFRLHARLHLHIDFGVCVRSTFQHSGAALHAPPLGGALGGATFPLSSVGRCCLASSFGCCCIFPLLFSGAAFLSLLWAGFPFSSVGWCCLASSFFGSWCFASPHDGLGVGLLGYWAVGSGVGVVRWFGAGSCVGWLGFGVGVWFVSVGWGVGWLLGCSVSGLVLSHTPNLKFENYVDHNCILDRTSDHKSKPQTQLQFKLQLQIDCNCNSDCNLDCNLNCNCVCVFDLRCDLIRYKFQIFNFRSGVAQEMAKAMRSGVEGWPCLLGVWRLTLLLAVVFGPFLWLGVGLSFTGWELALPSC